MPNSTVTLAASIRQQVVLINLSNSKKAIVPVFTFTTFRFSYFFNMCVFGDKNHIEKN